MHVWQQAKYDRQATVFLPNERSILARLIGESRLSGRQLDRIIVAIVSQRAAVRFTTMLTISGCDCINMLLFLSGQNQTSQTAYTDPAQLQYREILQQVQHFLGMTGSNKLVRQQCSEVSGIYSLECISPQQQLIHLVKWRLPVFSPILSLLCLLLPLVSQNHGAYGYTFERMVF